MTPRPLIFDTTLLVRALRDLRYLAALLRLIRRRPCYTTTVTIAELYAGALTREHWAGVNSLVASFMRLDRLLTPTGDEWLAAGRLIAHGRRRFGGMEPRDHYPDVLIAQVTTRLGATLITANVADFQRWAELGRLNMTARADV